MGFGFKANGRVFVKNLGGCMSIGDSVRINSSKNYNPIGGGSRTIIELLPDCNLRIGNHVGISNTTIVCSKEIIIGDYVDIGDNAKIYDTDFHSLNPFIRSSSKDYADAGKKKIIIGDYSFIGTNVIILKGSKIGKYSIVGAGSVVAGTIPDYEIWGGNPAKYIRRLTEKEITQMF
ncbi:MAG: acyltransferase [Ruminococcus sp.]